MKRNIELYLNDILKSIILIEQYSKGFFGFKKSMKNQDAIIRRLEIIGEAMKKIPKNIKQKHPYIKWNEFEGIRNFVTHVYFGINVRRIWKVVEDEIPILKKQIIKIKKEL